MSSKSPFELRPIVRSDIEQCLEFLRENFFPFEPCAVNINLCPLGYRIPALEESIQGILEKGYSIGAFRDDAIIGLVILDDNDKCNGNQEQESKCLCQEMPEKFLRLDKFFKDLCTNYGQSSTCLELNISKLLDVFIICTARSATRQGLANLLMLESLKTAKDHGFEGIQCMALSLYSQKLCVKNGFQALFKIKYSDVALFKADEMGDHQEGILFACKL